MFLPNLTGAVFLLAGLVMTLFPPRKINSLYGYRTMRSMKNIDNWNLAQQLSAKYLIIIGLILLLLGATVAIFDINEFYTSLAGFAILILAVIFLFVKTESALKILEKKNNH